MTDKQFSEMMEALKGAKGKDKKSGLAAPDTSGDDPATAKQKMENYKKQLEMEARSIKLKTEDMRLEAELNISLWDRAKAVEGLMDLETALGELKETQRQAINDANEELAASLDEEIQKTQDLINANKKLIDSAKKTTAAQKKQKQMGDDLFNSLAAKIGLGTKAADTYTGKLIKFVNVFKEPGGFKNFGKSLVMAFANLPLSLIDSIIKSTIEMAFGLDNARASFNAATQSAGKYDDVLTDLSFDYVRFGIFAEDAGKAVGALHENFYAFNQTSKENLTNIGGLTAKLEKLGVSGAETAKVMNYFNKNLGQTGDELIDSTASLMMMGNKIGLTASKMSKDFIAALPKLAVYGSRAKEIFGDLAAFAHRAGVQVSSLLDLAGKFDTFASAAETAGKLNAILGTQMSATEMLMMTEEQRIETLILQVQASGMAFRDMDRFTQKSIAAAAGINDMNEAQRIFGGSLGDYQKAQAEMKKHAEAQEEVDKAIKKSQPAMMKLKIVFAQLVDKVVASGFLDALHDLLDIFIDAPTLVRDWIYEKLALYAAFRVGLTLIPRLIGGIVGMSRARRASIQMTKLQTAVEKQKVVADRVADGQQKVNMLTEKQRIVSKRADIAATRANTAATRANTAAARVNATAGYAAAAKMAAFGVAIASIGLTVWMVAKAVTQLVKAFKDLNSDQITAVTNGLRSFGLVLAGMAATLIVFSIANKAAAPQLYAFGVAIGLMGAAVFAAASGLALLVNSLSGITENGVQALAVITKLVAVGGLFVVLLFSASSAVAIFGAGSAAAAPGISAFATAMLVMGAGVLFAGAGVNFMADAFRKMSSTASASTGAMVNFASALFLVAAAVSLLANPLAKVGMSALLAVALAMAATAAGMAAYMKYQSEYITNIGEMSKSLGAINFEATSTSIKAIGEAIKGIDTALGDGKRRIQIISTLENLSVLSTSQARGAMAPAAMSSAGTKKEKLSIEVKNEFKDLVLVLKDGTQLDTYILNTVQYQAATGDAP